MTDDPRWDPEMREARRAMDAAAAAHPGPTGPRSPQVATPFRRAQAWKSSRANHAPASSTRQALVVQLGTPASPAPAVSVAPCPSPRPIFVLPLAVVSILSAPEGTLCPGRCCLPLPPGSSRHSQALPAFSYAFSPPSPRFLSGLAGPLPPGS